ncbi:MAG: VIT1/CCC1 transporter family protein [Thioalkalivibrio sp.]|nr:VIT1/CCC1 transporter family protein [Thioalkalivibrio sp.]
MRPRLQVLFRNRWLAGISARPSGLLALARGSRSWSDAPWGVSTDVAFMASIVATAAAFLVIGVLKGRVLGQGMLRSGAETLAVGGGAAVLAYLVGTLIRQAAGVSGL